MHTSRILDLCQLSSSSQVTLRMLSLRVALLCAVLLKYSLKTPFSTPKRAEDADLLAVLQHHLPNNCRSRGLVHQRAQIHHSPLSQALLDKYHGFWEITRCGQSGHYYYLQIAMEQHTCTSPRRRTHELQPSLWESDGFSMTRAQKSSFISASDLIYRNSPWCISQEEGHMGRE